MSKIEMGARKGDVHKSKLEILGERMRGLIEASGAKQSDVARELGLTASRLSNYLQGCREPDLETLSRFATHYQVPLDYFSLADCESCSGDVRDAIRRYIDYLSALDTYVRVDIVTDLGTKKFSIPSIEVSRLIEYADDLLDPLTLPNKTEVKTQFMNTKRQPFGSRE
jgi:transcriptional regulator with XRE-family HTH domain